MERQSRGDGDTNDPPRITDPSVTKPRKRGLSLRSQLLNKKLLNNPATNNSVPDIELSEVDASHEGSDSQAVKTEPKERFAEESYHDLVLEDREPTSGDQSSRKTSFLKNLHNKLLGVKNVSNSKGQRRVPLQIGGEAPNYAYLQNKQGKSLLKDPKTNKAFCDNNIKSSRYTLATFVPRQLYAQFSKVANCYFLCISIMQMIPSWSTTGTYTTIIPLMVFVSISIAREGYDDWKRHRQDKDENHKKVMVVASQSPGLYSNTTLRSANSLSELNTDIGDTEPYQAQVLGRSRGSTISESNNVFDGIEERFSGKRFHLSKSYWKDVRVGQVIVLKRDDWVPADIILLSSTGDSGEVFIETMALDGETNLKAKVPHPELYKRCNTNTGLEAVQADVSTENPNLDLYNFEGSLKFKGESISYPLGPDNIVYRGSIIRNTDYCLGLVIFTGEETKIRMNAIKNPRTKAPKLQRAINMIVFFMIFVVASLSAFLTMAQRIWYEKTKDQYIYLYEEDVGVAATLMGYIVMLNTLIPLSLYVTMEIIKAMQLVLLQSDIDMYDRKSNTPAEARTATILEELGQVSYIFSDKTGTLTDNLMLFRKFTVAGTAWVHDIDLVNQQNEQGDEPEETDSPNLEVNGNKETLEPRTSISHRGGQATYTGRPSLASISSNHNPKQSETTTTISLEASTSSSPTKSFSDPSSTGSLKSTVELIRYLQRYPSSFFSKQVKFMLLSLALCHSCLPRRADPGASDDDDEDNINYQASSPDELALVIAARDMGYIVFDRKLKMLTLKVYPNSFDGEPVLENYEILDTVEFTSSRKRMSVIVKFPDGRICMLTKGADNVMLERFRDKELVERKIKELKKQTSERKNQEADIVLQHKNEDASANVRTSISSIGSSLAERVSLQIGRTSLHVNPDPHNSIDGRIMNEEPDEEEEYVKNITKSSRKSIHLQQAKKYDISSEPTADSPIEDYVTSEKLVFNEEFVLERTLQHIEEFSVEGLRTLMYCYRWLDKDVYERWSQQYADAKSSLTDRKYNIEKVGEILEFDFELVGATAIEDKLQEGVPEAIEKLRKAGIKLWMLTGDKKETAINIGYSCKLIKDYSSVVILSSDEGIQNLSTKMAASELEIKEGNVAHCVVVVDGATFTDIENDLTLMTLFIELGVKADSVICCRASPSQKATMVSVIRKYNMKKVTLAIGDGANDIAMIQQADIGIGITGKEGLQAARTSDYSIAQFRFLLKLLLVHGRYNYIRTCKFVLCTFYKEILFYLTQAIYQRYTLFTGSSLYESWSLSMFNTLFTSLPVLCIGMLEKDLKPSTLLAVPALYKIGRNYEAFNLVTFIYWMLLGTSQSLLISFANYLGWGGSSSQDNTTYPLGVASFTALVFVVNLKCQVLEMHNITKFSLIGTLVSCLGWFLWLILLTGLYQSKDSKIFFVKSGLFHTFGTDITWWCNLLVLILIGPLLDIILTVIKKDLIPSDTDIFQNIEKIPMFRKTFEIKAFPYMFQGWTWPHESVILEEKKLSVSPFKRNYYNFKSILKKGSTGPTMTTRKRNGTLPSIYELPPGSPSVVRKVTSKDGYESEILPSGKVIQVKHGVSRLKKVTRMFKLDNVDEETDYDTEAIIDRRIKETET
ncbi:Aminophospholipid translocase (flippase) [Komagataella phaffii CBS 7435]|uniref:Phospholipid-transporting ATPase n=2 Tax=Komagataella phaffii TaxID=460519 RepID=C4QZH6_KOMPG|nr:uncharacterized protein PAS_chr2-1_0807 [Komagataella phaffii GS115]AOA62983.1 GQ67_00074T0 [Komagataella phaffii]CAH2448855.1 Aminophospholipid translocase (flippase) [Komagataella phaffii CBS 7435]AOA67555.1 GQ68_01313T0 [Komagataella phaffii GS115]CAY68650.1 hypothetical protein PAS_chr2-1_0807 [Komagataella phaffii GS115]CCA38933.1 Aminophospholipid translocase (flippase) [Komagataella phaffii CBS 7435]